MKSAWLHLVIISFLLVVAHAALQNGGPSFRASRSGPYRIINAYRHVKQGGLMPLPPRAPPQKLFICLAENQKSSGSSNPLLKSSDEAGIARDLTSHSTIKPEKMDKESATKLLKMIDNIMNALQTIGAYCAVSHSPQGNIVEYYHVTMYAFQLSVVTY